MPRAKPPPCPSSSLTLSTIVISLLPSLPTSTGYGHFTHHFFLIIIIINHNITIIINSILILFFLLQLSSTIQPCLCISPTKTSRWPGDLALSPLGFSFSSRCPCSGSQSLVTGYPISRDTHPIPVQIRPPTSDRQRTVPLMYTTPPSAYANPPLLPFFPPL